MFKEHNHIIWGTQCPCGRENFILQDKYHPWDKTDYKAVLTCPACDKSLVVDQALACNFYNQKILNHFEDVKGRILDLGCGGGFLSHHLIQKDEVSNIYATDVDKTCEDAIKKIVYKDKAAKFIACDLKDLPNHFEEDSIDYLVSRDVFMFVEDPDQFFDDMTSIVKKGMRQMAWFVKNNDRMKNQIIPEDIESKLRAKGWQVELTPLAWYKSGYFIKADKDD